jgi:hypothetical protein
MILLDISNDGFVLMIILILLILLGVPIILSIIGLVLRKKKPKTAKVLFIIAAVYVLIGLGICGTIMN